MKRTGTKAGNGFKLLLAAALAVSLTAVCGEARAEETAAVTVEYENLKELLKAGNVSLKQQYADSDANIADYAEIVAIMDWERSNLEDKAEEAEEAGTENAALYASNASMLKRSAKSISKQIDRLTGSKAVRTLEKSANTYTMAAQTVMNSYNQMAGNLLAREKSVEALTASYNETVRRQSVGSATLADVSAARDSMEEAVNSLESLREQAAELRRQLLSCWGWRMWKMWSSGRYLNRIWRPSKPLILRRIRQRPWATAVRSRRRATHRRWVRRRSTAN